MGDHRIRDHFPIAGFSVVFLLTVGAKPFAPSAMRKAFAFLAALLFIPQLAFAQINVADTGLLDTGEQVYGNDAVQQDLGTFIGARIINPMFAFLGLVFFVLIIAAGFKWMTAGGKMDNAKDARQMMTNATVGLIVILAAYAITRFVLVAVTGG